MPISTPAGFGASDSVSRPNDMLYQPNPDAMAIRRLYMDDATGEKTQEFELILHNRPERFCDW